MAKKSGSSSWLTVVKRAFRSPTKDSTAERNSSRWRDESHRHEQEEHDDRKKREKRRWLFRKPTVNAPQISEQNTTKEVNIIEDRIEIKDIISSPALVAPPEHRHAIAASTTPTSVAYESTTGIARLTRPKRCVREHYYAAIVIQTAFRGYLARRALRALKELVKLQALVRGQNVRKQAKLTLKCMEALVRVQDQVSHQRARLSIESRRKSMLAEISSLWDYSTCLHDIHDRVSISKEMSSGGVDDWPHSSEDVEAKLQARKEAALRREKAIAYAFSNQIRRVGRNPSAGNEEEIKWLDRWMATKQWESEYTDTPGTERRDLNIRTVQLDTSRTHSSHSTPVARWPYPVPKAHQTGPHSGPNIPSSPLHKAQQGVYSPATPSPCTPKPLKVRSASPRYSTAHTPSMAHYGLGSSGQAKPNYMAATESTKARARPNSTPRQRASTPERDQLGRCQSGSAKKRLSYNAVIEPQNYNGNCVELGCGSFEQHLRSPSFKSLQSGYLYGVESLSSCYDENIFGRDLSPCSTTDLRWLK